MYYLYSVIISHNRLIKCKKLETNYKTNNEIKLKASTYILSQAFSLSINFSLKN